MTCPRHPNGDGPTWCQDCYPQYLRSNLGEFVQFAQAARGNVPASTVDWSTSPFAWMRSHGPRTKSKLGRDIVEAWLRARGFMWSVPEDGVSHFMLPGYGAVVIHLALLGKEGKLEFANLREPGLGADSLWLLGIEPLRVRLWRASPSSVKNLPTYANDNPGYHHCSVDPEDPPAWMTPMEGWYDPTLEGET